jgi:F-type H+-transporting ATPase subunit epsilon
MHLKILQPFHIFSDRSDVSRIVAEGADGSFGLLPQRRDGVTGLVPGILSYVSDADGEIHLAIDAGVLIKAGFEVLVSVRRAIAGADFARLRQAVTEEFMAEDELALSVRRSTAKLEAAVLRGFVGLPHV